MWFILNLSLNIYIYIYWLTYYIYNFKRQTNKFIPIKCSITKKLIIKSIRLNNLHNFFSKVFRILKTLFTAIIITINNNST